MVIHAVGAGGALRRIGGGLDGRGAEGVGVLEAAAQADLGDAPAAKTKEGGDEEPTLLASEGGPGGQAARGQASGARIDAKL